MHTSRVACTHGSEVLRAFYSRLRFICVYERLNFRDALEYECAALVLLVQLFSVACAALECCVFKEDRAYDCCCNSGSALSINYLYSFKIEHDVFHVREVFESKYVLNRAGS